MPKKAAPKKKAPAKKAVVKKVVVDIDPRCRKCRKIIQGGFLTVGDTRACSPACAN